MTEEKYLIIIAASLLFFFLMWKEVSRKNKAHLLLRMIASFFSVASFLCMALPFFYNKKTEANHMEAVIVTEGFSKDSIIRFLNERGDVPIISFNPAIQNIGSHASHYVADAQLLSENYKDIKTFHVFGFGFNSYEMDVLQGKSFVFHPTPLPSGITSVNWPQKTMAGEKLIIQGKYNNLSSSKAKIIISQFGAVLDSAYVAANSEKSFSMSVVPKQVGRASYVLAIVAGNDTVKKETIPVQVEEGKLLTVLLLSSSPDFDTKFLKKFLSEQGYKIATRIRISKEKYATNYQNIKSLSLNNITTSLLTRFDVLIADASELNAIPKPQLAAIQAQVQKGLGLLVKADTLLPSSFSTSLLAETDTTRPLAPYLLDTTEQLPSIINQTGLVIRKEANAQAIAWDGAERQYANYKLYGAGRFVCTSLANTYTWALSGHEEAYQRFWTVLINKAVMPMATEEVWSVSPVLPVTNFPVVIQLQTKMLGIQQAQVNGTPVYLQNHPDLLYQWSGTYYPEKWGWQQLIGLNGSVFYWFAWNPNDWQNVQATEKMIATKRMALQHQSLVKDGSEKVITTEREAFPKIYFFILFVVSCGYLWLERKKQFSAKM